MKEEWKKVFQLFWSFFKIGPVTFGGGYAMIPLIEKEVVHKKNWVKSEDLTDVFAIAGTIPGAIAVNAATFIGHRIAGIRGAIAATLGTLLPTFIIVLVLCGLLSSFQENPYVESAFFGIRAATVALIVYAGIKIARTSLLDKATYTLALSMILAMLIFHWHPIFVIFLGALLGILIINIKEKLGMIVRFEKNEEKEIENKAYSVKKQVGM
ncbi:chromate transporter [Metabacillus litoralis]|uniref:Chromate transporter n=1 Tax=Metabacillus litoralis TaxID=152268 RepID=A0A179T6E3_9BACI|nr:chromate transporter [Metabacillus litoralis]OAS89164.1 chromate transporter [Metabacillus litoralis]